MLDLTTVKITDIIPNVGGYGLGNSVKFTYVDGESYRFEQWHTDTSGGCDFYDSRGCLVDPTDNNEDDFEVLATFLEKVLTDYEERFDTSINPLIQELVDRVINDAAQYIPEETA